MTCCIVRCCVVTVFRLQPTARGSDEETDGYTGRNQDRHPSGTDPDNRTHLFFVTWENKTKPLIKSLFCTLHWLFCPILKMTTDTNAPMHCRICISTAGYKLVYKHMTSVTAAVLYYCSADYILSRFHHKESPSKKQAFPHIMTAWGDICPHALVKTHADKHIYNPDSAHNK